MPKTFTVHDLEAPIARRLSIYADRGEKSLNQAVKELLAMALGVTEKPKPKFDNGLFVFRGRLSSAVADRMLASVANADFSKIDEEDL